jgi:hypothetical protein
VILALAWVVVTFWHWGGIAMTQRNFVDFAGAIGADVDYMIVGDSKAGPFSTHCTIPWLYPYRGIVHTADSVTPVYHWYALRQIRKKHPEFRPRVVFVFVGANNMNANGLHARRDYTFFNQISLSDAWALSAARGDVLTFAEVLLARVFPVYGRRVQITHLQSGERGGRVCPSARPADLARPGPFDLPSVSRNPVDDKNYYDIYRRSVYANYESAESVAGGLEKLLRLIQGMGAVPVLVLPPVASEMWALEQELVGTKFDETIAAVVEETDVQVLDLREVTRYEFRDVNHLSPRGAREVARAFFAPVLRAVIGTASEDED